MPPANLAASWSTFDGSRNHYEFTMNHLAAALAVLVMLVGARPATAADIVKGDIKISQPWARATPGGAKVAAGYVTITNTGRSADKLTGGTAAAAATFEIHDMTMTDGVMRMRRLDGGLVLEPGATVALKPGGLHVMMIDLKQPLKAGETMKGTLVFEKAGTVEIVFDIAPIGAPGPGQPAMKSGDMKGHKHH